MPTIFVTVTDDLLFTDERCQFSVDYLVQGTPNSFWHRMPVGHMLSYLCRDSPARQPDGHYLRRLPA
jgi:hypothetical protein